MALANLLGITGGLTGGHAGPSEATGAPVNVSLFGGDRNLGTGSGSANPAALPAGSLAAIPVWGWLAVGAVGLAAVTALLWSPKPKRPPPSRRKS